MAENINNWQDVSWQMYPTLSLKEFSEKFNTHQVNIRKAKQQHNTAEDMTMMQNLYDSQVSAQNKNIAEESGKAIRKTQVAYWIRDFYNKNYSDELNNLWINLNSMSNEQVIDWYTDLNPNSYDTLKDYVVTNTDINNPLNLYYTLWLMPSKDSEYLSDRIKTSVNQIVNGDWDEYFSRAADNAKQVGKDFLKNELSWPTELYYGFRNYVNWVKGIWDNDSNWFWALQNYAHEELWKDVSDLTDMEFYWITEALKNPEIYANYEPTVWKAWIESLAWLTDTIFTIAARPVKALFSYAEADPALSPIMDVLWRTQEKLMWEWIWWILTFPLEYSFINDLPENDKKKWHAWLWSILTLWLAFKARNSWPRANDLFRWVLSDLWIDKIIGWFEDKILKPVNPLDIAEWLDEFKANNMKESLNNSDYYNSLPADKRAELDLHTNKVLNSDTIAENKDISRALMQLNQDMLKNVKSYEEIFKLNKDEIDSLIGMENTIAQTIEKKFWPEEDIWEWDEVTVAWKYKWETEPNRPIKEFFDTMKLLIENSEPNLRKALNAYEQKYLDWNVDVNDLLNFKRALSQSYMKYKYNKTSESNWNVAWWKKIVWDSDIKRIYDWLNYLIRDAVEWTPEFRDMGLWNIMQTLDQRLSPHLNLRTRLIVMANALNKEMWKIPEDILWRKVANNLRWIWSLSFSWIVRWLAEKLTKSKEKMTSPTDYASNLHRSLKEITNILKEFPDEQRWLIMNSLADYLKRKIAWTKETYWWKVEWEVVEEPRISEDEFIDWESEFNRNPFLEDIVEIVPKESNMLWEDTNYNWNPVDYTTPTRVTEEGYPWRYWAISESYKWNPAWDFWTPANYEKVWETYSKAMDEAWFSEKQKARVKEELEKNAYKIKQQPSLFEEYPTQAEAKEIIKQNKWQETEKMDLKSIVDELKELEEAAKPKKAETKKTASKKVTKEDIDHLFWKDKPELKKWKKSDK